MTAVTDVLLPASPDEAVSAFGDGAGVTVIGGGTIVMPDIAAGRLKPARTLLPALAVSAARLADGSVRLAATGAGGGGRGVRLHAAEAAAGDPEVAGEAALEDVTPHDDVLASAWYRRKVLPVLVRRALTQLQET